MRRILWLCLVLLGSLVAGTVWAQAIAPAPAPDPAVEQALELGKEVVKAARGGDWHLVMVSALMLTLWVGRKLMFMQRIPKQYMPWMAIGLSTLTVVAANLQAGWGWWKSISGGLVTGLAASGFWELLGKYIFGGQKVPPKAFPVPPQA